MGDHLLKLPSSDGALMLLGESGEYESGVPVFSGAEELEGHCLPGAPIFK